MIKDPLKFVYPIPSIWLLNEVNYVAVCNNLIIFIVYSTLELDPFRVILHSFLVIVHQLNDLCSVSGAIILTWHEKGSPRQFLWG
jgi:hypothetical protein